MESLVDERPYHTYVLITGDRDFSPLVHALRKRDKQVIGIGVKHTTSSAFASFCDQYLFYEDIIPTPKLDDDEIESLLLNALSSLVKEKGKIRASVLKQHLDELSQGGFSNSNYAEGGFRKFLERFSHLVQIEQEGTTTYVTPAPRKAKMEAPQLHLYYCTMLKKQKLRVVPPNIRLLILKDVIVHLKDKEYRWRSFIDMLIQKYKAQGQKAASKNMINAILLLAREAHVIQVNKADSLAQSLLQLVLTGDKVFQQAIILCDQVYLQQIMALPEPFDIEEAALALYQNKKHAAYLQHILPVPPIPPGSTNN